MEQDSNVRVAVRIRPQLPKEQIDMCHICTRVTPNEPQVWLGTDKAFTFDHVFDRPTKQEQVYDSCVRKLIDGCFEGYNATVLAYGQTGSGKTFTMGTGFDIGYGQAVLEKGIIPRAVEHLYYEIARRQAEARQNGDQVPEFNVSAQFLELYNEDIIDLLADERSKHAQIKIHEDASGQIYTAGVTVRTVSSVDDTLQCLRMGALSRTTASTQMNTQSSRSHAIFTLHIKQHRVTKIDKSYDSESGIENGDLELERQLNGDLGTQEFETLTAKFHFVDLAGSERLKRTGATGERAREGISINSGLLALGNVISALGDKMKRSTHVPYRDSKLTRLLQDSLGGNSMTLMIACVSPSDRDFMETLNTLRYANRAKNIKNKVVANQDKSSQTISALRREIQELQIELQEYKQGKRILEADGTEKINDMYHENTMLQTEINNLKTRIKALQETNERLTKRNTELLVERETGAWIGSGEGNKSDITDIVHNYMEEIEKLRTKLMEMEETCSQLRKQVQRQTMNRLSLSPSVVSHYDMGFDGESSTNDVLEEAKSHVAMMKRLTRPIKTIKEEAKSDTNGNDIEVRSEINGTGDNEEDVDSDDENTEDSENEELQNGIIDHEQLASLSNEIDIKEKLIMELEKSQKKMNFLKQQYEEKLQILQNKIAETEAERDMVLTKLNTHGNQGEDKAKKVKEDYEKKLNGLQHEMRRLQAAKREHAHQMKSQSTYEHQLRVIRNEVEEMKKQKVRLLSKLKEDAQKHREQEIKITKKIVQLTKQDRQKELKIRSLEVESNRYKNLLKRKDEEVIALKHQKKQNMSDRVAGRALHNYSSRKPSANRVVPFSPVAAKHKWQKLEQNISKLVLNKQTVAVHEKQMERYINQRKQLSRALERTKRKYNEAVQRNENTYVIQQLQDELESIEANMKYINESIDEIQSTIMQIEEDKDNELIDTRTLTSVSRVDEIKYLFEKALAMAVNQALLAAQKEEERKEFELKYKQTNDNSLIQEQLLQHVLDTTFIYDQNAAEENDLFDDFQIPAIPTIPSLSDMHTPHQSTEMKNEKARRLTKTPQELLFETSFSVSKSNNKPAEAMTQSLVVPSLAPIQLAINRSTENMQRIPSAPSLKEITEATPPNTPPIGRRFRDENVFSRLTSTVANILTTNESRAGHINAFNGRTSQSAPLVCTHVAEGHTRPVQSVVGTNDVLFSGSKDCSVKIWDLHTGQEIQSLTDHPDAVQVVRYNEYCRLAFSVSKSFIKVWDPRDNPARCVKTLNSSGLVSQGTFINPNPAKSLELAPGECSILDIQLSTYGTTLFSTCSRIVRIWDLRMYHCIGKLNTGHQAGIICMAVEEAGVDNNIIVTGSKDHYIKVFEVTEGHGGIHNPKVTLKPPHYDGIESLVIYGDYLFSGSRDSCIKKWDLQNNKMLQSLNNCHKDWIQALSIMPNSNTLLSGCRSGQLKLWSTETCNLIGDIKAHSSAINSIDTNSALVFTGSSDNTINIWRKSGADQSPEGFGDVNE